MVTGHLTSGKEAVVPIDVLGPPGQVAHVEAAIDTGYDGFLTLPAALIHDLSLLFAGYARALLGDGNEVRMEVFKAAVLWDDRPIEVLVLAAEGGVLLGMELLTGSRVTLDVEEGGAVTIESLEKIRGVN
jgi:clan AA aspartic protease